MGFQAIIYAINGSRQWRMEEEIAEELVAQENEIQETAQEITLRCAKCGEYKIESLFVQTKGKRVGMCCRMCRNKQIIETRKNKEQIAIAKAEKKRLDDAGLAVCNTCEKTKSNDEFPQQFGKRWGLQCKECQKEFKKYLFISSDRGIKIQQKKDDALAKKIKEKEEKDARNIAKFISGHKSGITTCSRCGETKDNIDFPVNKKGRRHGKICLSCMAVASKINAEKNFNENPDLFRAKKGHHATLRRCRIADRTPAWSDIEAIKQFYINRPEGYHVDHVLPLFGNLVSGLHVLDNLQYLTAEENFKKNKKFDIEEYNGGK